MDGSAETRPLQRWCASLPEIDEADLEPSLRPTLRRRVMGLRARAALGVLAMIGSVALAVHAGQTATAGAPLALAWWLVAGLSLFGLVPLLALATAQRIGLRRALERDLTRSRVLVFGGQVGDLDGQDRTLRRLVSLGHLRPHLPRDQSIELLPASRLVVRINGRAVPLRHRVHVAELAPVLAHAMRSPLPRELIEIERDGGLDLARRGLSPAEHAELQRYGAAFRRRYWITVGVGSALSLAIGVTFAKLFALQGLLFFLPPVALMALGGVLGHMLWLRLAHRVEHDCELRWVISVRDPGDADGEAPRLEVLPVSQLVWTEGSRPAAWRLSWR